VSNFDCQKALEYRIKESVQRSHKVTESTTYVTHSYIYLHIYILHNTYIVPTDNTMVLNCSTLLFGKKCVFINKFWCEFM